MTAVRARRMVAILAVSLLAFACASPPEAEKKAADAAVSAATSAGAEQYAKSEFAAMAAAAKKAEAEMSSKAYKEAKASYESVKDLADKATKAAVAGKAAARAEAQKQLADLDARWTDLMVKAEAATKTLKADQKTVWDTNGRSIGQAFDAARTALADDAAAARDKLAAIPPLLDRWEADIAALAAPKKDERKPAAKK